MCNPGKGLQFPLFGWGLAGLTQSLQVSLFSTLEVYVVCLPIRNGRTCILACSLTHPHIPLWLLQVWNVLEVLNVLQALVDKSAIVADLESDGGAKWVLWDCALAVTNQETFTMLSLMHALNVPAKGALSF